MEDIEDMFKNDEATTDERIPQSKRKIMRNGKTKKETEK